MTPVRLLAIIFLSVAALAQQPAGALRFNTAAVRASAGAGTKIPEMRGGMYRGGRYEVRNARVVDLIGTAWDVDASKVRGGPAWLQSDRFDINASAPEDSTSETLRLMLRALLADRFQLSVHNDTRQLPAYVLSVGKKLQMQQADGSGDAGCSLSPSVARRGPGVSMASLPDGTNVALDPDLLIPYSCKNVTMSTFAELLPNMAFAGQYFNSHPVVDRTGLSGAFNFDFKYTPNPMIAIAGSMGIPVVTITEAVAKHLGLSLELTGASTPVIAVDHVSRPTEDPPNATQSLPASPKEFEVADVKPSDPNSTASTGGNPFQPGGRLNLRSYTLRQIVSLAWNIEGIDGLISGPKFLDTTRFNIVAKAAVVTPLSGPGQPVQSIEPDSMRLMLQQLLRDRFHLAAHYEDRPVTGYVLTAMKSKLKEADPANNPGCHEGPGTDGNDPRMTHPAARRLVTCTNVTMAQFATELRGQAMAYLREYPPVADDTGLHGVYDITLNFSQLIDLTGNNGRGSAAVQNPAGGIPQVSDPGGAISLFDALEKQLGLKLELKKHPVSVLVVDHIEETPTEN